LLTREDLRIRLRSEGLKRVQSFTARGMAQAAWKVYEEAVEVDSADRDE
jgi:phosphoribosyl-ATP pyrophosphohydrolase